MAAFAQFGSDLDKATRDKVRQGERLMEALKQRQGAPYSMIEEAVILFVAVNGRLASVYVEKVAEFISGFLEHIKARHPETLNAINETKEINEESEAVLSKAADEYAAQWKN
jgi:F-type H+-transporting ATPase subunit alpha